jgi:hypothetical protein
VHGYQAALSSPFFGCAGFRRGLIAVAGVVIRWRERDLDPDPVEKGLIRLALAEKIAALGHFRPPQKIHAAVYKKAAASPIIFLKSLA